MAAPLNNAPRTGMNVGAYQIGPGTMHVGVAIGQQNLSPATSPVPGPAPGADRRADLGVITILPEETRAVVQMLKRASGYRTHPLPDGAQAHEADVAIPGGGLRLAAVQALDRGPMSAVVAYHRIREHYAPPLVALVGIAGGIRAGVAIGDVVIADSVIFYDSRRESPEGTHRRGRHYPVAPEVGHRLNAFQQVHGATLPDRTGGRFQVYVGPIGSGDAVITDERSPIRRWLAAYHEKVLAVETEAGGIAQACHEEVRVGHRPPAWVVVRGISDTADAAKGHQYHQLASDRAALVLETLLPYLRWPER